MCLNRGLGKNVFAWSPIEKCSVCKLREGEAQLKKTTKINKTTLSHPPKNLQQQQKNPKQAGGKKKDQKNPLHQGKFINAYAKFLKSTFSIFATLIF